MKGFLLVVDREGNDVLGPIWTLEECRTESEVALLIEELQTRLGAELEVLDSRYAGWPLTVGWDPDTGQSVGWKRKSGVWNSEPLRSRMRDRLKRVLGHLV